MKEIIYQIGYEVEKFLLTNKEFKEAMLYWQENNGDYYCHRLETFLTKHYKFARTPSDELGYEIFFEKIEGTDSCRKIFKKNNKYYKEIKGNGDYYKIEVEIKDKTKLIEQEKTFEKGNLQLS